MMFFLRLSQEVLLIPAQAPGFVKLPEAWRCWYKKGTMNIIQFGGKLSWILNVIFRKAYTLILAPLHFTKRHFTEWLFVNSRFNQLGHYYAPCECSVRTQIGMMQWRHDSLHDDTKHNDTTFIEAIKIPHSA